MDIQEIIYNCESDAKAAGFKTAEVCKEAGLARTTFWRWKNKKAKPNLETVSKFQEALERLKRRKAREGHA
jgi:DNA-binding phage protein